MLHRAYEDTALPIGGGQTISQPYVQARSLEVAGLTGEEKVLEVGTGSGYQTALLSSLASMVFSVERMEPLARRARELLQQVGCRNVSVMVGDGTLGWRPYAPYDAIIVSAASPEVPQPLLEQLAPEGELVIPLGDRETQVLTLVRREGDGLHPDQPRRRAVRAAARPVRLLTLRLSILDAARLLSLADRNRLDAWGIPGSSCSWRSSLRSCRFRANWSCRRQGISPPRDGWIRFSRCWRGRSGASSGPW